MERAFYTHGIIIEYNALLNRACRMGSVKQQPGWAENAQKIYGRRGALTVQPNFTRDGYPTLTIEAASRADDAKRYEWQTKISVQLTRQELPPFCAVAVGLREAVDCPYHGPARNKGLVFERQADKLYLKVSEAGRVIGVPIGYADGVHLAALAMERLKASHPTLDSQTLLTLMRQTPG
jgi:hypothetical protein